MMARVAADPAAALLYGAALMVAALLAGCEALRPLPPAPTAPPTESIVALLERPAERALVNGLRHYDEGAFERAEQSFRTAVLQGPRDRRDLAVAHKYLAFIACAFNRLAECEQQFRHAIATDPEFQLNDAEIGHPIWGPVYRRVAAHQKKTR